MVTAGSLFGRGYERVCVAENMRVSVSVTASAWYLCVSFVRVCNSVGGEDR
jgi:hypothetical protein